jgi:formate dehydrogenase subunit delta
MNVENLVTMANQIGAFFSSQGTRPQAVAAIADHLRRFWEPRMLHAIDRHVDAGAVGLQDDVADAVRQLRKTSNA